MDNEAAFKTYPKHCVFTIRNGPGGSIINASSGEYLSITGKTYQDCLEDIKSSARVEVIKGDKLLHSVVRLYEKEKARKRWLEYKVERFSQLVPILNDNLKQVSDYLAELKLIGRMEFSND